MAKAFTSLAALAAFSQALALPQTFPLLPIRSCEWIKPTTAITNFTLFHATTGDRTGFVQWDIPVHHMTCYVSDAGSTASSSAIGEPGVTTNVPCAQYGSNPHTGSLLVSEDKSMATLKSVAWEQCAVEIYQFYYQADIPLSCASDASGGVTCVAKENATASIVSVTFYK
jgi:hypothetical protein